MDKDDIDIQAEREGMAMKRHRELRPARILKKPKKYYPVIQRNIRAKDNTEFTKMLIRILY